MELRITFKDPDGVYEAINHAARLSVGQTEGLSSAEKDDLRESRHDEYYEACSKWIRYGEYVTILIDTETGEARVEPQAR